MFFIIKAALNSEYFYCLASTFYFLNGWIIFFFLIKVLDIFFVLYVSSYKVS